jgi:Tol biopolymer transport system component
VFSRYEGLATYNPERKQADSLPVSAVNVIPTYAAWSPNGQRLSFSGVPQSGPPHLFIANADGSGAQQVTFGRHGGDGYSSWSPSGRSIAFGRGKRIAILSIATRKTRIIASGLFPEWDPTGRWIAYTRSDDKGGRIYEIRANGSGLHALTPRSIDAETAAWAPDGRHLVFGTQSRPGVPEQRAHGHLDVLDMTTGKITSLTHAGSGSIDGSPTFSATGRSLAYVRTDCPRMSCTPISHIEIIAVSPSVATASPPTTGPLGGSPAW